MNVTTAPDGSLFVSDMYTGIIQDAQFIEPDSYLRRKINQYALDKQHNWGRIWRVTHEGSAPDRRQPRMYSDTAAQLVKHLEHPHGWWRDTAQKLLVLRQDKTVVPALRTMASSSTNQLARIHALWTLEGLDALSAPLARDLMKSPDPKLRVQAIRASETLFKGPKGDKSFAADYQRLTKDTDPDVVIQSLLTLKLHRVDGYAQTIASTMESSRARGVREIAGQLLKPGASRGQPAAFADPALADSLGLPVESRRSLLRGQAIYTELCSACHGPDGKGAPMGGAPEGTTIAPPLASVPRVLGHRDYVVKVLLHGMSGELDGKTYPGGVMVPMGMNTDEWIADAASYIRNSFGNNASFITPEQVAAVRKANPRSSMWSYAELLSTTPMPLLNQSEWKATASHNPEAAQNGINGTGTTRWATTAGQEPGMWYQIELPRPVTIAEMFVDASVGAGRGMFSVAPGTRPAIGPIAYRVQVSMDGTTWSEPVAESIGGSGISRTAVIAMTPVKAKFVRITLAGKPVAQVGWAIQRVRIFGIQ